MLSDGVPALPLSRDISPRGWGAAPRRASVARERDGRSAHIRRWHGDCTSSPVMYESAARKQPAANLGDLVEDALEQAKTLVQAEFSLARAELWAELKGALRSALLLG